MPFLAALILRFVELSAHSLLLDEAFVAVGARDIAYNHTPMWDAISNAPFVWVVAQIILLAHSDSSLVLRFGPALMGSLTVVPLYFLSLRLFNKQTALLSALLFAVHPFAVAFSRILFADPFQVFFVVLGWLAIDHYADATTASKNRWCLFAAIVIWALAFLMKYNAVVPGGLWVICGVASGRYLWKRALISLIVIGLGSCLTLAIWPYDAPVWLLAFLEKGGQYNLSYANIYYQNRLHLLLFGATELTVIAGLFIAFFRKGPTSRSLALVTSFVLAYLVTVIFLGRTFQRYLLVETPVSMMLISALLLYAFDLVRSNLHLWKRTLSAVAGLLILTLFVTGCVRSYGWYSEYLKNDTDASQLAHSVKELEQSNRKAFWFVPEPIAAYYMGFTQHYSRAVHAGLDLPLSALNYFEYKAVPYSEETETYNVLEVRKLLRRTGLFSALSSPGAFYEHVQQIKQTVGVHPVGFADYLNTPLVRSGDMLVVETGVRDILGEPILENIRGASIPPQLTSLPVADFSIIRNFCPDEDRSANDTIIRPITASAWVLIKH